MKYCVLIIDGASGWPLAERGGKTTLELAHTPNLDRMGKEGVMGMVRTVPPGMEPSSACACMSLLGYDPVVYYRGRSAIEAVSMGIPIADGEVLFRCNLVSVEGGEMRSYCGGHISGEDGQVLIGAVEDDLGSDEVSFYPGVGYRHICKIAGHRETLQATCTPPHDIPNKPIAEFLPSGTGSEMLRDLMARSEEVLKSHSINAERRSGGELEANMIWLFWGSGEIADLPSFKERYGLTGALTSGVDLLRGLAKMAGIAVLDIPGVTDNLDNNYSAQGGAALEALEMYDMVVIHVEAPDEAAHAGAIDDKIEAIQRVDGEVVGRILSRNGDDIRALIMPDHPTPIAMQTHSSEPVPFLLWGPGFTGNGAKGYTEEEAKATGLFIEEGYTLMGRLVEG